jgi:integrase
MPKKRNSGDGGLYYIKSRKLWRGVVDDGFWPDGRRRQRSVTAKTQAAARAKLDDLKTELKENGAPADKKTTVAEWSRHWLDTVCRPRLKPNGLAAYESVVRSWIIPTLGRKVISLLKPSDVRELMRAIEDAGKSTATARKTYGVLSLMLESARLDGLVSKNVCAVVVPPKVKAEVRGAFSAEDAIRLIVLARSEPNGTRWMMTLAAGMRQAERLGAQIDDLDITDPFNAKYKVRWTLDEITSEHGCGPRTAAGWPCGRIQAAVCPQGGLKIPSGLDYRHLYGRLCLVPPKSGRERETPIIPAVAVELQRHLEETAHIPNPHGLIWRHEDGSPILPREDQADWRSLLLRAGLITEEQNQAGSGAPTSHWARHTTATLLMELGVDSKIIGEIVGHGSEQVTRGYQHVSSSAARDAMNLLGSRLELGSAG